MKMIAIIAAAVLAYAVPVAAADSAGVSPWWKAYLAGSRPVRLSDGRTLNLYCEGAGAPTVVMESGLGSAAWTWHTVQDEIARRTRVCVYDRAGYFRRSTPARARDAGSEAEDLAALVKAASLPGPYLLVGHSYGGYIVRLFAYRHPREVAGMVLVDPSSEYQEKPLGQSAPSRSASAAADRARLAKCASMPGTAGGDACVLRSPPGDLPPDLVPWFKASQDAAYAKAMLDETDAMDTVSSAELVKEKRSLGGTPVILLERDLDKPVTDLTADQRASLMATWHKLHVQTLSGISTRFEMTNVADAGHRVQDDRPDAVIAAVFRVLDSLQASGGSAPGHH